MSDTDSDLQAVSILPPTAARLIRLGSEIAMEPPARPDFPHYVLCQVGLPRRRVIGNTFERMNGHVSLLVEAGKLWNGKEWQPQPLPYGTRSRLALVHVSSEAVRTKSPNVEVGHSAGEFLLRLGISTGGEEYANFNRQRAFAGAATAIDGALEDTPTLGTSKQPRPPSCRIPLPTHLDPAVTAGRVPAPARPAAPASPPASGTPWSSDWSSVRSARTPMPSCTGPRCSVSPPVS